MGSVKEDVFGDAFIASAPLESVDIKKMYAIRKDWFNRLWFLRIEKTRQSYPSDQKIMDFTKYLIEWQRDDASLRFGFGSWGLPEEMRMPGDAAVDFVFVPSYIAVSWLVLMELDNSSLLSRVDGVSRVLSRGFRFVFSEKLRGHGYDADREMLEAIKYLSIGKVFSYLHKNRYRHAHFVGIVEELERRIETDLPKVDAWGGTREEERNLALELMRGGDNDDDLIRTFGRACLQL